MRIYFAFLFLTLGLQVFSQTASVKIDSYKMPDVGVAEKLLVIEMPYGKADIRSITGDTLALRTAGDIVIDLVYSDFPATASLEALNRNRIKAFLQRFPFIDSSRIIAINFNRQMKGDSPEKADTMFHGLVVRYRPLQSKETMRQEIEKLEQILTPQAIPKNTEQKKVKKTVSYVKKWEPVPYMYSYYDSTARKLGAHKKDSIVVKKPAIAYGEHLIDKKTWRQYRRSDSIMLFYRTMRVRVTGETVEKSPEPTPSFNLPDTTVMAILNRVRWTNTAVVADVTGSMYPFTAQLLVWIKLNSIKGLTTKYAFFNDGNDIAERKKKIGSTGGIFSGVCQTFDEVKSLVYKTMQSGSGGTTPENDIEALLEAQRQFPETDCLVLIADNWAPVRDKVLIPQLKKPVRIVLCGARNGWINTDFLDLARATNGSLHLMEEDLYDLGQVHRGQTITIGNNRYRLTENGFVRLPEDKSL